MSLWSSKPAIALFGAAAGAALASFAFLGRRRLKSKSRKSKHSWVVTRLPPVEGKLFPVEFKDGVLSEKCTDSVKSNNIQDFPNEYMTKEQLEVDTNLPLETKIDKQAEPSRDLFQLTLESKALASYIDISAILDQLFDQQDVEIHLVSGNVEITRAQFNYLWPKDKLSRVLNNGKKHFVVSSSPGADYEFQYAALDLVSKAQLKDRFHVMLNLTKEKQIAFEAMHVIPHCLKIKETMHFVQNQPLIVTIDRPSAWWSASAKNDFTWFFASYDALDVVKARNKATALTDELYLRFNSDWKDDKTENWPPGFGCVIASHCKNSSQFIDLVVRFGSHSVPATEQGLDAPFEQLDENVINERFSKLQESTKTHALAMDIISDHQVEYCQKVFQEARELGLQMRAFVTI